LANIHDTQSVVSILNEIAEEIVAKLDVSEIVLTVYEHLNKLIDATFFAIGLYKKETEKLALWGVCEKGEAVRYGCQPLNDESIWSVWCFLHQQEFIENDNYASKHGRSFSNILFSEASFERKSMIYLPLTYKNKRIGIISVQSREKNAYTPHDLNLLKNLAIYITIALDNASNYVKIKNQSKELLHKSIKLQEAHENLEKIVEQRTAELERQKKELEKLSIVAEKTDNAIMIMDAVGNIIFINNCFTVIYEYTYEQFISKRGNNILQTSFNPNIKATIEKCINEKITVYYEALNITLSGKSIWTHTTLTPILDDNGDIRNLVTIDSDITRMKQAERKIIRQNKSITDSIHYASRIQEVILPPPELLDSLFCNYFVFYKPKDIVSGDFYWAKRRVHKTTHSEMIVIAAADCTGHGVPGAFMSMLGITLLNEIISNEVKYKPNEILDKLRTKVKKSLRQTGKVGEQKDGLDISLCVFEPETRKLQFAGANNSLVIVKDNELIVLKADRQPIGVYAKETPFNNYETTVATNDTIYLFSDGFLSQFGGVNNHKYKKNKFYQLLINISKSPVNEQKDLLENEFQNWRGKNQQVDDILVLGIQL